MRDKISCPYDGDYLVLKRYPHYIIFPLVLYFLNYKRLSIVLIFSLFLFLRSPDRSPIKYNERGIYSPADGVIMDIQKTETSHVVCIFLSIMDTHVQYAPTYCKVVSQFYKKGQFNAAYLLQKSAFNERLETNVVTNLNDNVKIVQIAGQIAQRIETFVKPGDNLKIGCRLGVIKFGSRVDVHIPHKYNLHVKKDDILEGGVTLLASSP